MKKVKELTKAEEQVMQILWKLEKAFVKDVMEHFDKPKPAYNTVSTIIRILEKKGFVSYKNYGSTYEYFPLISKEEYSRFYFGNFIKNYFGNSYNQLVSFFSNDNKISVKELEEMKKILDKEIKNKKSNG
ncbi:MAG TPA: BlaI/MecI/CopY family transcriptional regulator [Bacteroidales bacterium]|nr:BlaI/MecI/CopY family transcriptional regulator [Bacteroidales bacterium]HPS16286.1 BlaI/MecI/CopY family transcriptional regulator [Bacteroidales bacterium]